MTPNNFMHLHLAEHQNVASSSSSSCTHCTRTMRRVSPGWRWMTSGGVALHPSKHQSDCYSSLSVRVMCFVFSFPWSGEPSGNEPIQTMNRSECDSGIYSKGRSWTMVGWRKENTQFNSVLLSVTPLCRGHVKVGGGRGWSRLSQSLHKRKFVTLCQVS